jgi:hypothetical protein
MAGDFWNEDIWTEIDGITDPATRSAFRRLYRMILEMYDSQRLAKQVAQEINKQNGVKFTRREKTIALFLASLTTASALVNIFVH